MVPASMMGLSVTRLLAGGQLMGEACRTDDAVANPGLRLGAALGAAAAGGRDKCTLICSPRVETLGMWLEQLLAESTGKEGKGIVPIEGEPLGAPDSYGDDRFFVYVRTPIGCADQDPVVEELRAAGQPVFTIQIDGPEDLGAEFLRWEVATATAGAILGIDPFDQPNVQESKDNTKAALERFLETGDYGVDIEGDPPAETESLLHSLGRGDYFAILAYTQPTDAFNDSLRRVRAAARDRFGVATTSGYGPRYLHSTGQLHKGGPNSGVYLILAGEGDIDVPIPGEAYGFKTLIQAQWRGDLKSLRDHGRRVAMMPLDGDREATMARILDLIEQAPVTR
jgi:glucose-6-phosphate isomerase/transaldolase/glucose-6-phosphate isomerase